MKNKLPKIIVDKPKRLGQGYGSGKGGHTSGRGQKGQKSRSKIGILFEGYKMKKSFFKRLPFARGKGKFRPSEKPLILDVEKLNIFKDNTVVDIDLLIKNLLVNEKKAKLLGVKILGNGNISKSLTVKLPASKSAIKKIEKAGGKVEVN